MIESCLVCVDVTGDENDSNRGQQLIHGKEEAGEAPVKGKCRKKLRKKQSHYVSERRS